MAQTIKTYRDLDVYQMAFEAAFISNLNDSEAEAVETGGCLPGPAGQRVQLEEVIRRAGGRSLRPKVGLKEGIARTYAWIEQQVKAAREAEKSVQSLEQGG